MMKGAFLAFVALSTGLCTADDWSLVRLEVPPARGPLTIEVPQWTCGELETNRIDLLVVFDASARRWLADCGLQPDDYAKTCVDDLNRSLAFTGIDRHFAFRLACALDLSPEDLGDYDLRDIVASFTPALSARQINRRIVESVLKAREGCRADIVAILTTGKTPNIYGDSGPLNADDLTADGLLLAAERAFCACRIDSLASRHTLLHEIGHLFGAGHSDVQKRNPGPQLFACSSAYRFKAGETSLTTVMGYPEEKDSVILPFFSSPEYALSYVDADGVRHAGIPVGTPTNDNMLTVLSTFPLIAQYRVSKPTKALAQFEQKLAFGLSEDGKPVAEGNAAIALRCGVRRLFSLDGIDGAAHVRVSRLPSGFSYDGTSRTLSGRAMQPGDYVAVFTFEDESSTLHVRRRVAFHVEPLPDWALGNFATEDYRRRIGISATGRVRFYEQKAHRVVKATQEGFVRELADSDGTPIFVLEDGKKLRRTMDGGRPHGVIDGIDGMVYLPAKKPIRKTLARRRGNLQSPNPQEKKENTP